MSSTHSRGARTFLFLMHRGAKLYRACGTAAFPFPFHTELEFTFVRDMELRIAKLELDGPTINRAAPKLGMMKPGSSPK